MVGCTISGDDIEVGKVLKHQVKDDTVVASATGMLNAEKQALQDQGVNEPVLDFILIQDYMESGAYSNTGAKHNNPGNIMWPAHGLPYGKKGPYNAANHTYYASFSSIPEYVKEKIRVLNQKPGVPMQATSNQDFVHRLKLNNYFGKESEASYYNKMKGAAQRINLVHDLGDDTHQDITDDVPKKGIVEWWEDLPAIEKAGLGAAAVITLFLIIR